MSTDTGAPLHLEYLDPSQAQPEVKINAAWDAINSHVSGGSDSSDTGAGHITVSDGTTTITDVIEVIFSHSGSVSDAGGGVAHVDNTPGGGGSDSSDSGTPLSVSDGTTTVADVTEIIFTGATVTASGSTAEVAISGGGGGGSGASSSITLSGTPATISAATATLWAVNLTANTAVTLAGAVAGSDVEMQLVVTQGGTSAKSISWVDSVGWSGGTGPTLTTTLGRADIIRLFNGGSQWYGVLEATNVFAIPPAGPYDAAVLASGPVVYYKLADTSGTTAVDSGPNSINGAYTGSYTLAQTTIGSGLGLSVAFSAAAGQMTAPHNSLWDFASGNYSLELWMKSSAFGTAFDVMNDGLGGNNYRIYINVSAKIQVQVRNTSLLTSSATLTNGTAYHIVVTYDSGTGVISLYINGSLDNSATVGSSGSPGGAGSDFVVGNVTSYNQYAGTVSNVAMYASALSSSAVSNHYSLGH